MGLLQHLGLTPLPSMALADGDDAQERRSGGDGDEAPGKAKEKASPADALDAKLGTALDELAAVLDGIHDDAAAAPLRAQMQKVVDGRAAAGALAEAKRLVALRALLASVARQKPLADAALKKAQAVDKREAARKEIDVAIGQVTALVLGGINHDAMRNAVNADLTKAKANFDKADKIADLAKGEKAFLAMKPEALALVARAEKAKSVSDAIAASRGPLDVELKRLAGVLAAMGPDGKGPLAERLAELTATKAAGWPAGTTTAEVEKSLTDFQASVTALSTAIGAMKKVFDDKAAFEKAYAAIKASVDDAALYHGAANGFMTAAQGIAFVNAKQAVDNAVALPDWVAAKAALPALKAAAAAVLKSRADRSAYNAAIFPLAAQRTRVTAALAAPGLPAGVASAYRAAFGPMSSKETARDWVGALAAVPAYKKALADADEALDDGKKFYTVYAPIRAEDIQAQDLLRATDNNFQNNAKLSAAGSQFAHYREILEKAIAAPDWGDAKDVLADLQVAAREFIAEAARHKAASAPYETALAALRDRYPAERAVEAPLPPLAVTAEAYKKQRKIVYAAADEGDFTRATAALPQLQTTIDALMAVKGEQDAARSTFIAAWGGGDYAAARQVATADVPALADAAKAFLAADKAVEDARKLPDWVRANAALPALQAAATKLVQAKAAFNTAAKPADAEAFAAKLKALEPRTDKSTEAPVPPFIDTLQKTVQGRLSDIANVMSADPKDLAAAESSYALMLKDLDAMEAGKARHAAHRARFLAMKNGAIQTSLAVALVPPALAAERAAALAATEAKVVALADKGDTAGADAKLAAWALEAKGWQETQAAYAELHSGKVPSVDVLSKLAAKPGGDQALDDMILKMSGTTPAKVLGAVLKARFGFEVKRLDHMNADIQNLKGTGAGDDPERNDPELDAMYKVLAQIPSKRIKGKISEMVDFNDADGGGVYYGGSDKKIYLHAGRIGDASSPHTFHRKSGEIMPNGEEVEENCKPKPGAPDMPQADHTLMHETAHAEDDGIKFMESRWNQPEFGNWREESPKSIAKVAAPHLGYDEDWICDVLKDPGSKPPKHTPKRPKHVKSDDEWSQRREKALLWCQSIRSDNNPWWKGSVCAKVQIGGRVYHEAYPDGRWRSYDYSARAKGISGYQFRAEAEWFAELYAAYFGGKLKDSHPAMRWLVQFKPQPA